MKTFFLTLFILNLCGVLIAFGWLLIGIRLVVRDFIITHIITHFRGGQR